MTNRESSGPTRENVLKEPVQHRSRDTLERILAAAEALMEEGSFDEATVAGIVKRAGASVGSFYARFPDKQALFHVFQERFFARVRDRFDAFTEPALWRGKTLAAMMRDILRQMIAVYRGRRGVFRAVFLHTRIHADAELLARGRDLNRHIWRAMEAHLMHFADRFRHPVPRLAIRFGLAMVAASLRDWVLFEESRMNPIEIDDEGLARELARAFCAYLYGDPEN